MICGVPLFTIHFFQESDTVIVDALRKLKNLSPEINIEQINEVILGELANNDNLFVKGLLKK